jgi:hypothetical protein
MYLFKALLPPPKKNEEKKEKSPKEISSNGESTYIGGKG